MQSCFPAETTKYLGFAWGANLCPFYSWVKLSPEVARARQESPGWLSPLATLNITFANRSGLGGGSQGGSPGPGKLGVPGSGGIFLQGRSTQVPAFRHLAVHRLLGKKDDK